MGVDEPRSVDPPGYEAPPPFAPPQYRVPPLNETQVFGRSSYPPSALAPAAGDAADWVPMTTGPTQWPAFGEELEAPRVRPNYRRRGISIVTVVAVCAALAVIAAVLLAAPARHRPRTLSLPTTVDEYARLSTISGAQLGSLFDGGGGFAAIPVQDLAAAKVAVYGDRNSTAATMIFIGFTASDSPTIGRRLRHRAAGDVTSDLLDGAGTTSRPIRVDAGPLGGAMTCGSVDLHGQPASAGVWADRDTLGIVLIVGFSPTEHTSLVTRDFRSRAEH
jgi:hypothetical protein